MSQPSRWINAPGGLKLSAAEDPNDKSALQRELENIRTGMPNRGVFRGEAGDDRYEEFATITPPDLTRQTRIVAVLGVHTGEPTAGDGFFLSDFCAFWHLFSGKTANQTWLHCLDIAKLSSEHKYLHGNPFKDRKVVLDADIYQRMSISSNPLEYVSPASLKLRMKQTIRQEYKKAQAGDENLLLMLFGHGYAKGRGIEIGTGHRSEFTMKELSREIIGTSKVMLLTNACYSGGWVCSNILNITGASASGDANVSLSWTESGSSGRAAGTPWASMVIERLTQDPDTQQELSTTVDDMTELQEASYSNFTNQCYRKLLENIDRRGYEHYFSFSAQDDAWGDNWRQRTGIPLADFQTSWAQLRDAGRDITLHPGDPQKRDPTVPEEVRKDFEGLIARERTLASSQLRYNSAEGKAVCRKKSESLLDISTYDRVCRYATQFFESFPGEEEESPNVALFGLLRELLQGNFKDDEHVERAYLGLKYRTDEMEIADNYVRELGIGFPHAKQCYEFDHTAYRRECRKSRNYRFDDITKVLFDCGLLTLFPIPPQCCGPRSTKGEIFLTAAIDYSNLSIEEIRVRLERLVALVDSQIEDSKELLRRDVDIIPKRRKLFEAFGKVWGDISPKKRSKTWV
jgi:hypothetical protein